ncbi:hypothetical protein V8C37DRAFT_417738 [Trichoderma ceciliae]
MASQPTSRTDFGIAIVCSKELEYNAVCHLFDVFWDDDGDTLQRAEGDLNTYTTGCMGKVNIVVVLLCKSGKGTAASAAASLRTSYPNIQLALLIGICHGVPNANGTEVLLGDVIISETIIQYDLDSDYPHEGKKRNTLGAQGQSDKNIRNFITNIDTELGYQRLEKKTASHLERIQRRAKGKIPKRNAVATYEYPGSANDILFEAAYCHKHYNSPQCECADYDEKGLTLVCDDSRDLDCELVGCENSHLESRKRLNDKKNLEASGGSKEAQQPSIFFGRFGSGDKEFSSGTDRDRLAQEHGIMALEMEGAGAWEELSCVIVKGVSDYGDGHKTKHWRKWQKFAAATAASVARGLVEYFPQTDKPLKLMIMQQANETRIKENETCLRGLRVTDPRDDKVRIQTTKGGLLRDSYIWILDNDKFKQWRDEPEISLLWIRGDAGKGKTMLMCGIIDELEKDSSHEIYYFLCQATDSRLDNATAIIRGLIYMIIHQHPPLIAYVREEYDKSGKSAFENPNAWVALTEIFFKMLEDPAISEPIFVIDALDECVTGLPQLLELIVQSPSASCQAKWLVSSRNEAGIRKVLGSAGNKSTVSLKLDTKLVSAAILTYIRHKVQHLSERKNYKQATRDNISNFLSNNADGTFLWVALVCALLEEAPLLDPLPKTAEFPPGLDQLYERMMKKVCDSNISDLGRQILAIAAVVRRPLTIQEFNSLVNNTRENGDNSAEELERLWEDTLSYCGSFLTMRNHTVYFVHQSAKDFLIEQAFDQLFPDGMESVNRDIFKASISIMRTDFEEKRQVLSHDPLAPVRYSCVYWIDHYEQSRAEITSGRRRHSKSHKVIYAFLQEKYVHWLEALSLLGSLFEGVAGIKKLEGFVADTATSGLKELVRDALRFVQMFGKAIADSPLQVYLSALLFSPSSSITSQLFRKEASNWVRKWPTSSIEWAPYLRRYEGHKGYIHELDISSCGTWLASSSYHGSIDVWEISTGKIIWSLEMAPGAALNTQPEHQSFLSVRFSPWKPKELGSSWSNGDDIVIWDVTTGDILQKLGVGNEIQSFSFLVSNRYLLSCLSKDRASGMKTASVWNIKTGQVIRSTQLLERLPIALTKLPNDDYNGLKERLHLELAAVSPKDRDIIAQLEPNSEDRVEILNIDPDNTTCYNTNKSISSFYLSGIIKNIRFSPDGNHLAAAVLVSQHSPNFMINVSSTTSAYPAWNFICTSKLEQPPALAFSPDGRLVAIAADEGIHILDTVSGECLGRKIMQSSFLVFSPDGNEIFSANASTSESDNSIFRCREEKSYSVDPTESWITFNGEKLAWIPPECRSFPKRNWDALQNYVVISRFGKPASIIQFCGSPSPEQSHSPGTTERREAYTYTRRLDDWIIEHLDMKSPDDNMMTLGAIESKTSGKSKEGSSNRHRKASQKLSHRHRNR